MQSPIETVVVSTMSLNWALHDCNYKVCSDGKYSIFYKKKFPSEIAAVCCLM